MKSVTSVESFQFFIPIAWKNVGLILAMLAGTMGALLSSALPAQDAGSFNDRWRNWSSWDNRQPTSSNPPVSVDPRLGVRQQSQAWSFGARGISTPTGIQLRDITSGSPAARAGLRVGDSIVAVAGGQVGLVGGRLLDLDEAINTRADSRGVVPLLVFGNTTSRLEMIDVQLMPAQSVITGTITGLDRVRLPSDAMINVQMINLTRPHFGVRNGTVSLRPTLESATFPFTIAYDPAYIYTEDEYAVRAQVISAGNVIFHSDRNQRVLTQGAANTIQLRMVSADTNWSTAGTGVGQGTFTNSEAINRQIQTIYRRYLGRDSFYIEQAALMLDPRIEDRLRSLPFDLMATQEYYDAAGNNEAAWITRIFRELAGRPPQPTELQNWQRRFADLRFSRATLLTQLQSQIPR